MFFLSGWLPFHGPAENHPPAPGAVRGAEGAAGMAGPRRLVPAAMDGGVLEGKGLEVGFVRSPPLLRPWVPEVAVTEF